MILEVAALSHCGGRSENQDAAWYRLNKGRGVFVVADGLGGHRGGKQASELAIETLASSWSQDWILSDGTLETGFQSAHMELLKANQVDESKTLRTTLVALLLDQQQAIWAHAGDSRLYLFREGRHVFNTADHSVPYTLLQAGEITIEEIRGHDDRNRLTKVLGEPKPLKPALAPKVIDVIPGDVFLLCSDGFWEVLWETEMEIDLAKAESAEQWLHILEERLITRVRSEPDHDNYTALTVWIHEGD
jgi:serine/threonine protein phosphatase PrpC